MTEEDRGRDISKKGFPSMDTGDLPRRRMPILGQGGKASVTRSRRPELFPRPPIDPEHPAYEGVDMVKGRLRFVFSKHEGLQIYDTTDPLNTEPREMTPMEASLFISAVDRQVEAISRQQGQELNSRYMREFLLQARQLAKDPEELEP